MSRCTSSMARSTPSSSSAGGHGGLGQGRREAVAGDPLGGLQPRRGQRVGQRRAGTGHLGEVDRPGPGDDVGPLIAASPGGQPLAAGRPVGEVVQRDRGRPVGRRRQAHVGQGVGVVAVATQLGDEHRRGEGLHQWRHHLPERPQPGVVAGERGQGHVHARARGIPVADLGHEAGAGEQRPPVLVERDGQHPGVAVEDLLHPVAVVDVDVDVRHPRHALVQQPGDGDGGVVVDAKAAGPRRAGRGGGRRRG